MFDVCGVEVVCDKCMNNKDNYDQYSSSLSTDRKSLIVDLKRPREVFALDGWILDKSGKDYCPVCAEEMKKKVENRVSFMRTEQWETTAYGFDMEATGSGEQSAELHLLRKVIEKMEEN